MAPFADIVGEDGHINRNALGAKVFADKERLTALNQIVWPAIARMAQNLISKCAEQGTSHTLWQIFPGVFLGLLIFVNTDLVVNRHQGICSGWWTRGSVAFWERGSGFFCVTCLEVKWECYILLKEPQVTTNQISFYYSGSRWFLKSFCNPLQNHR